MSRLIPWRNKPTPFILQMIPVSKEYKLYLVSQTGPTSFVFKDDDENKFKVSIGLKLSCSCGIVQNDHCIHTLYVLLKKYKVDQNNPIIWQASYTDAQLDGMIQMKYAQKKKVQKPHKFIRKRITDINNNQQQDDFPKLDGDQTCPICYEQLKFQAYSQCKQCSNCIHSKCLKIWTKHKQQSGMAVTCPMCRAQFINPMHIVLRDLEKWQNKFLIHKGTKCVGCNLKNIKGWIFHCLICDNTNMCKLCFESNLHNEHDKFFMKQNSNDNWIPAFSRINMKGNKLPVYKSIYDKKQDQFQKGIQKSKSNFNLNQFLVKIFPTIKETMTNPLQNNTNNLLSLNIIGNQVKLKQICYKCNKPGNEDMRKLYCGHTVHEQCLLQKMILTKQYQCEVDGQIIFKGYLSAMGIKYKKQIKENMVDVKIMRNQQQKKKIQSKGQSIDKKKSSNMAPFQIESHQLALNSAVSNKSKQQTNKINKIDNSLRAFRIKKNHFEKKNQLQIQNQQDLVNSPLMMITGIQQQQNLRARSVFRQGNI